MFFFPQGASIIATCCTLMTAVLCLIVIIVTLLTCGLNLFHLWLIFNVCFWRSWLKFIPSLWQTWLLVQHKCQFENRCVPGALAWQGINSSLQLALRAMWQHSVKGAACLLLAGLLCCTAELSFLLTRPCFGSENKSTAESLSTNKTLLLSVLSHALLSLPYLVGREKTKSDLMSTGEVHCLVCLLVMLCVWSWPPSLMGSESFFVCRLYVGRTTVCSEPRKAQSMHVDGELMGKQVGAQLSLHFSELVATAGWPDSELVMFVMRVWTEQASCRRSQCSYVTNLR